MVFSYLFKDNDYHVVNSALKGIIKLSWKGNRKVF